MRSLRRSLTLGVILSTAVVLAAGDVALYVFVRSALVKEFDLSLIEKVRLLASTTDQKPGKIDLDLDELNSFDSPTTNPRGCVEVWADDGSVLFRSHSLGQSHLGRLAGSVQSPVLRSITLPSGRPGRAVGIKFTPPISEDVDEESAKEPKGPTAAWPLQSVAIVLARDTAPLYAMLYRLRGLMALGSLAVLAVCAAILGLVVRSNLRPLDHLAAEIGRRGEQDLATRIAVQPPVRELQPVVDRLNHLLGRLETAFQRERSFSAEIAHELRTPLAGLRSTLEVALLRPRDSDQYRESLDDALQIAARMQSLVENLLSLARIEAGLVTIQSEPMALNELVETTWKPFDDVARARRLNVQWTLDCEISLTTDPTLLGHVLRNIMQNAVEYANEDGWVKIETASADNWVSIRLTNSGSTISQSQSEYVFERFWRGDAARSSAGKHCGIGLPLVRKILDALGGSARVRTNAGAEFEITISLPSAPNPAS